MAVRGGTTRVRVRVVEPERVRAREEQVVTEEPLEVRVAPAGAAAVPFTTTMRTPGADMELAAGLLHAEGVLTGADDLRAIRYCTDVAAEQQYNVVTVDLRGPAPAALVERARVLTTSACGVCGTASLDALAVRTGPPLGAGPVVAAAVVASLPERLRERQVLFERTGGLHAAGLFAADGEPLAVREDVGRHNAVDKVVGWALLQGRLPSPAPLLAVSGRAGYEITQKALAARIPVVVSVSAPTSLSVDLARRFGLTLVGFAREGRFTVYAGAERIAGG